MPLEGQVQPVGDLPAGPVPVVAEGGITTGTTVIGLEITVVLTEPELLVLVDVVVTGRVPEGTEATSDVEEERPSKRIV
ncbi:hypothetical protein ALP29_200762 [Pseudomonas syringae pv. avii]|uniref:Uncharacterized protein n=1 Tax=Pseudomonas syringae pv. avii TaxID=663959 RepID=A0A3M5UVF3_PSESX|nr:hypothetical protein ALP29_200762 [Pseudomonas syringae pv. avii]